MKITIRLKLISIVSILVLVVLGLTITQSVNAWRQRSAAVQFGNSEAAASAVLEAGSLMAVERGTTNAVLAAAQIDPAQRPTRHGRAKRRRRDWPRRLITRMPPG